MDWTKTTARRDEKHLSFGIWCVLYKILRHMLFPMYAKLMYRMLITISNSEDQVGDIAGLVQYMICQSSVKYCHYMNAIAYQITWKVAIFFSSLFMPIYKQTALHISGIPHKVSEMRKAYPCHGSNAGGLE